MGAGWIRTEKGIGTPSPCHRGVAKGAADRLVWSRWLLGLALRASLGARHRQRAQQVVPSATSTRLHHICGVVATTGSRGQTTELLEFIRPSNASAMARKTWTEDVTHQHHVVVDTDRTTNFGLVTKVASSAQQVGVRIAHLVTTQATSSVFVDQRPSSQSMVDHSRKRYAMIIGERQRTQPALLSAHSHEAER